MGNLISIDGSTSGWIDPYETNTATIQFQEEGGVYPELMIRMGKVSNHNGSVAVERVRLVDFDTELSVTTRNYGPIVVSLPANLRASDGISSKVGELTIKTL